MKIKNINSNHKIIYLWLNVNKITQNIHSVPLINKLMAEWLQYSNTKSLFKKGEIPCISDYQPISLLKLFSKIVQ
jgi:hypothetical protein